MPIDQLGSGLVLSVIFAILGFILLFIGYKLFDLLTPLPMGKLIFEEGNNAAAIMAGFFTLSMAIIIASAIRG